MTEIRIFGHLSIIGWLLLNIAMSNVNKWIFVQYNFNYPIILTTLHMITLFVVQSVIIRFTPFGAAYGDGDDRLKIPPHLSRKVSILSLAFCISIACGNIALKYLYVSFLKMLMATSPAVTVAMSRLVFDYKHDLYVYYSMAPLVVGGLICTFGELNFSYIGFLAAVVALLLRSTKSILQGVLLKEEKLDSVRLLYHMSFPSMLILAACSCIFEYDAFFNGSLFSSVDLWHMIGLSCLCSVGYNTMNFVVTFFTSAVTLQVLGNVGIALNVIISVAIFQNKMSFLSVIGGVLTIVGVCMYDRALDIARYMRHRVSKSWGPIK
ncbi:uncharacterized protein [Ptychodera flava]|uniref:uncharacterized protein n=1 Tax=Ptychodera flava TaxID=63121 RepID=UPI003969F5D1